MSRFNLLTMLRAILLTTAVLAYSPADAGLRPASSPQARQAQTFLSLLEAGRPRQAYLMLSRTVRLRNPYAKFVATAPRPTLGRRRELRHERPLADGTRIAPGSQHVVCFVDVPLKGSGSVTHLAVVLIQEAGSWAVIDYRSSAEPHPSCAGHV